MKIKATALTMAIFLALSGSILLASNESEKVKEFTKKAAQDYLQSGLVLAAEGRDEEAAKMFQKAVATEPNWAEAHSLLGSSLDRAGNYPEAEKELRKAVQLKPDYAEGWYYLGMFYKEHGKQQQAEQALQKARQLAH